MSGISHYHAYAKGRNSSALGGSLEQIFLSVSFHIGDRDKIIWGFALLLLLNHSAVSHSTEGSTPGFPVLHNLPAFAQTHVHWVSDAIQPSHPLPSCPQSFPASGSFPMSLLFTSGGQSTGASASASVLPINILGWLPLGLPGMISLNLRDSQEYSPHHSWKASIKCYISP